MAGIYVHIPFCKQACHYCDFYFSTQLGSKAALLKALRNEIYLTKEYLKDEAIKTLYFGGGTPSLLSAIELSSIIDDLKNIHNWSEIEEITLEINPDDYEEKKFEQYLNLGINRLSIGIQSFNNANLKWMNRSHTAAQATNCVESAKKLGFNNISIDLIYGIPSVNHQIWEQDLANALALEVGHISAYCLTIESKTAFGRWKAQEKMSFATDDFEAEQFDILLQRTSDGGFEQYEISNFCKPNCYSKHNTNYWNGVPYLGLGPSAHSFNKESRQWNISSNTKYINAIVLGNVPCQIEILTMKDRANEYIMTSLRTMWGLNLPKLNTIVENAENNIHNSLILLIKKELIIIKNDTVYLTAAGKLLGDQVSAELFI